VIRVSRCEAENRGGECSVSRLPPVFLNQFWGANFLHPVCNKRVVLNSSAFRQD